MTTAGAATHRVGLSGIGRMGTPIARNLAAGGFLAGVHNRTSERAEELARELGVAAYATPAELAAGVDVVVTCVSDAAAVFDLYEGDSGFLAGLRPGTTAVDIGTIGTRAVHRLAELLARHECEFVDAPLSGSTATASAGTLTVMVGASPAVFERLMPVLQTIGSSVFRVGPVGSGAALKLAVNNVVYGLNQGISESLVLAERAGIDRLVAYEVFASSAVAAPFVHYRRAAFERPESTPVALKLTLAAKDIDLVVELAQSVDAEVPQARLAATVLREAIAAGFGSADVSAVAEFLRGTGTAP